MEEEDEVVNSKWGVYVYDVQGVGVLIVIVVGMVHFLTEEVGVELDEGGNGGGQIRCVADGVESNSIVDCG